MTGYQIDLEMSILNEHLLDCQYYMAIIELSLIKCVHGKQTGVQLLAI